MNTTAVRRALYGKLSGDTTLTSMLGTAAPGFSKGIYYQQAPEGATYPFVIFSKSTNIPTMANNFGYSGNTSGTTATHPVLEEQEVWLVKSVDHRTIAGSAETIASRIDTLLQDGSLSISGVSKYTIVRESGVDYPEVADGEQYVHSGANYRIIYS